MAQTSTRRSFFRSLAAPVIILGAGAWVHAQEDDSPLLPPSSASPDAISETPGPFNEIARIQAKNPSTEFLIEDARLLCPLCLISLFQQSTNRETGEVFYTHSGMFSDCENVGKRYSVISYVCAEIIPEDR